MILGDIQTKMDRLEKLNNFIIIDH
jgi:hypothetical protein